MSDKKQIKENEQQQDVRAIDGLNQELKRFLVRLGWNNPNTRNQFIGVINSYILSGENSSVQEMITTYLEKGLDVLNIELNKRDIVDKQSMTRVDQDDVEEEINETVREAVRKNRVRKQKRSTSIRGLSEIRKGLIDCNFSLVESGMILKESVGNKKAMTDIMRLIRENRETNDQDEQVFLNNFRTFFKMYLEGEYEWATDPYQSMVGSVISLIEKGGMDSQTQTDIDLKIEDLYKLISNNISGFDNPPIEHKNLDVATSELRKFAIIGNNWEESKFNSMFNNIVRLAVNSKNVSVQRKIAQRLSEIDGSTQVSKDPEPEKEPEKEEE